MNASGFVFAIAIFAVVVGLIAAAVWAHRTAAKLAKFLVWAAAALLVVVGTFLHINPTTSLLEGPDGLLGEAPVVDEQAADVGTQLRENARPYNYGFWGAGGLVALIPLLLKLKVPLARLMNRAKEQVFEDPLNFQVDPEESEEDWVKRAQLWLNTVNNLIEKLDKSELKRALYQTVGLGRHACMEERKLLKANGSLYEELTKASDILATLHEKLSENREELAKRSPALFKLIEEIAGNRAILKTKGEEAYQPSANHVFTEITTKESQQKKLPHKTDNNQQPADRRRPRPVYSSRDDM